MRSVRRANAAEAAEPSVLDSSGGSPRSGLGGQQGGNHTAIGCHDLAGRDASGGELLRRARRAAGNTGVGGRTELTRAGDSPSLRSTHRCTPAPFVQAGHRFVNLAAVRGAYSPVFVGTTRGLTFLDWAPAKQPGRRMNQQEVESRYLRLKQELAEAYASSAWDSPHIDRLARELFEIDRVSKNQDTETRPL